MVPKLFKSGKSFKGLAAYLLHDAEKAKSAERVFWTHSLNLANDEPGLVVDEMIWTARAADWLKRQRGGATGGRALESPVKHFSLNWHPSEKPSREDMVGAVESFLQQMRWQEHQAFIVCHDDKEHPHVHVMVNRVHPETGRALVDSFERRWAQEWAKAYELEHGKVFCEERLKPVPGRVASQTRPQWLDMRQAELKEDRATYQKVRSEFDYFSRGDKDQGKDKEWELLKAHQRKQREDFFNEGKREYRSAGNAAYQAVRKEFKAKWREFYGVRKSGKRVTDKEVKAWKEKLVAMQKAAVKERRQAAYDSLRKQRDYQYAQLLRLHRNDREELKERQNHGIRSYQLLDTVQPPETLPSGFRRAKEEVAVPVGDGLTRKVDVDRKNQDVKPLGASQRDSGVGASSPTVPPFNDRVFKAEQLRATWIRLREGRRRHRD